MGIIDYEEDEEMYKETAVLKRRHLTDEVLRLPLKYVEPSVAICFPPETPLQEVVVAMREKRVGSVLVTDKKFGKLVGIFTERDLLIRVAGRGWNFLEHKLGEVMTADPECLTPRDVIGFALNKMMTKGFRHIPIVGDAGKPYGIVSVRDLLMFLCEHFPEDVINLPPEPQVPAERDGG